MNEEEKTVTADSIDLGEDEDKYLSLILVISHHHKVMWIGHLGNMKVAENEIVLKDSSKPFKSAPYRSMASARQLETFKLIKNAKLGSLSVQCPSELRLSSLSSN